MAVPPTPSTRAARSRTPASKLMPAYQHFRTHPTPAEVDALFDLQRRSDPLGTRLHLALACIALVLAGFPTTFVDWAMLPLAACCLVRLITHFRVLGPLFWDPVARLTLALAAWAALSRFWTAGAAADWLGDFQSFRFAPAIVLLYPVLDRRRTLILALALGLLCGQASQWVHFTGVRLHLPALQWRRFDDRVSGWWDPVVAGSLLCAALGLALGARSERTPARLAGLALTLFSLVITGTRGAWIAAGALIGVAVAVVLAFPGAREPGRAPAFRRSAALALALVPILIVAAVLASPALRHRLERGVHEARAAITAGNYDSDTGRRLAMWKEAAAEFAAHPLRGVGAGGFLPYARAHAADPSLPLPHAHAHSLYFHTGATLGAVGLALLLALLVAAMRSARPHDPWTLTPALLGLALAGLFDSILINQQTANLLFILLALSVRYRPRGNQAADERR